MLVLLAVSLALAAMAPGGAASASSAGTPGAVPRLAWHRCDNPADRGFQCATARVPLDYRHPGRAKIKLAVIRHRASDSARRLGTIFWEPGGPGGSGTKFLPAVFDKAFPAALRARFDIASWDPRGVGASTAVQCFSSERAESRFFGGVPTRLSGGFPVGHAQMRQWIQRYRLLGRRCEARNGGLLRHVSTADTARDLDRLRRAVGDSMLNYIGTSYGTFAGATYANIFPSRVRAMALDGDVNPTAWVSRQRKANGGRFLTTGLRSHADESTAKTLRAFLDLCGRADTAHCAFSAGSPAATRAKFSTLLRRTPRHPTGGHVSYAEIISSTAVGLYSLATWGPTASNLEKLWTNGGKSGSVLRPETPALAPSRLASPASARRAGAASTRYSGQEQELAIACGETPNPPPSAMRAVDAFAHRRSGVVGPYWAWDYQPCGSWPVKSADRYTGPWNRRTAHPVLVIGNTFDPATPYRSAVAMSRQLARARLLTMDGYGHTALLNPSTCINRYESRYFISGALPPKGTRCAQDARPFGG